MTGSRISDPATAEDLTQEALERLVAVEDRLDSAALAPYAVVPARNAVRGWARRRERELRHGPRMLDLGQPPDPQERALQEEERRAVALALGRLPPGEREPLIAHDVEGLETRVLADRLGTTPGAVAVKLARARLRVEYLLALRRVELPTEACKRSCWRSPPATPASSGPPGRPSTCWPARRARRWATPSCSDAIPLRSCGRSWEWTTWSAGCAAGRKSIRRPPSPPGSHWPSSPFGPPSAWEDLSPFS